MNAIFWLFLEVSLAVSLAAEVRAAEPIFQEISDEPQLDEPKPQIAPQVSGVPRIVRQLKETEVFLKGDNKSYFIPKSDSHNRILEKLTKAMKAGSSVSFSADPVSRKIIEMRDSSQSTVTPPPTKQAAPESGNR
jgi:hypothetical protein